MADINTNEHGALLLQFLWELHEEEITSNLDVDLSQDVGSLR